MSSSVRGFIPAYVFNANGALTLYADAAAAGTFDPAAQFDGTREVWTADQFIQAIRYRQVVDGGGGTTTIEIFRRRAGANTSLGTVALAAGAAFGSATLTPATAALRTLQVGDILICQFIGRQTTTAAFGTIEVGLQ